MIEEVILAHGAHVGADAFADFAVELPEGDAFPLGGGLHDLGVDGMQVAIVRNVELDGGAGAVAIEHVVDATFDVDDERNLDHHQAELFAEVVGDIALYLKDGLLGIFRAEERAVTAGQDFCEFVVIADSGSGEIGFLVVLIRGRFLIGRFLINQFLISRGERAHRSSPLGTEFG